MKTKDLRPWWWWINPWLYIKRRDKAYDDALDSLYDLARPRPPMGDYSSDTIAMFEYVAGHCPECSRKYIKNLVEAGR